MRKYFLLVPLVAALTAFTRPASSTEITLYGVVDGYVAVNIAGSQLKSGIQSGGAKPSLWGIKGSEDLGNGWSSHFKLEQRVLVGSKQRKLWKSFIRPTVHALLLNHDHDRSDQHVAGRSNRKLLLAWGCKRSRR